MQWRLDKGCLGMFALEFALHICRLCIRGWCAVERVIEVGRVCAGG